MPGKNYTRISNLVCTKMKTSSNPFFSRNFLKHLAAGVLCALLASSRTSQQHVCSLSVEPTCRHMVHRVAKRGRSAFLDWGAWVWVFTKADTEKKIHWGWFHGTMVLKDSWEGGFLREVQVAALQLWKKKHQEGKSALWKWQKLCSLEIWGHGTKPALPCHQTPELWYSHISSPGSLSPDCRAAAKEEPIPPCGSPQLGVVSWNLSGTHQ